MRSMLTAIAMCVALFAVTPAEARGFGRFGQEDKIVRIEPVKIDPVLLASEELPAQWTRGAYLARRATITWAFAGAWFQDQGYVLVSDVSPNEYWPLDATKMKALHELGMISSTAPAYKFPALDYVAAYSLWILFALIGVYGVISMWITRLRSSGIRGEFGDDFPGYMQQVLVHAARADGLISDTEFEAIAKTLSASFGREAKLNELRGDEAGERFSLGQLTAYLNSIHSKFSPEQRKVVLDALAFVIGVDGEWDKREKKVFQSYLEAMGLAEKKAKAVTKEYASAVQPA